MPGPVIFGLFAAAHGFIALAALSLYPVMPLLSVCLFVVEAVTAYDNLIIVLGNAIGIGDRAQTLNRMRFFLHAICIGLLVPVYAGIAVLLDVSAFTGTVATAIGLAIAAAIAMFGYAVQYRGLGIIMPTRYFGCLRYAQSVDDVRRYPGYTYSDEELAGRGLPPFASIITVMVGLIISFWTGWSAEFWLPFVVTALMFSAAAFPAKTWGPLATSMIEIVYSGGLLYSLWTLAGVAP